MKLGTKTSVIFDVAPTDFIKSTLVSHKGNNATKYDKPLILVSLEPEYPGVSMVKRSIFQLLSKFINHCLCANVHSFVYYFFHKTIVLKNTLKIKHKTFQLAIEIYTHPGKYKLGTVRRQI